MFKTEINEILKPNLLTKAEVEESELVFKNGGQKVGQESAQNITERFTCEKC